MDLLDDGTHVFTAVDQHRSALLLSLARGLVLVVGFHVALAEHVLDAAVRLRRKVVLILRVLLAHAVGGLGRNVGGGVA